MAVLEETKRAAERLTGWRRPSADQITSLLRKPKTATVQLRDDGMIPNHPRWPLVIFRRAVHLPRSLDPAAVFEAIFESNGWGDSWRDGIYDYLHYHSRIHEVLGVARGSAKVSFGGARGRAVKIAAGDVVVLPAGTGHRCISASKSFLVVGAYPPTGSYDECTPTLKEHARAVKTVRKVARPRKDPLFGARGPLLEIWLPAR